MSPAYAIAAVLAAAGVTTSGGLTLAKLKKMRTANGLEPKRAPSPRKGARR
jgi:hypothetical protein